jgi:hypothetical protein
MGDENKLTDGIPDLAEWSAARKLAFREIVEKGPSTGLQTKNLLLSHPESIAATLMVPEIFIAGPEYNYGYIKNMPKWECDKRSRVRRKFRSNQIKRLWDISWLERSERSERSDQPTIFWSDFVVLST